MTKGLETKHTKPSYLYLYHNRVTRIEWGSKNPCLSQGVVSTFHSFKVTDENLLLKDNSQNKLSLKLHLLWPKSVSTKFKNDLTEHETPLLDLPLKMVIVVTIILCHMKIQNFSSLSRLIWVTSEPTILRLQQTSTQTGLLTLQL